MALIWFLDPPKIVTPDSDESGSSDTKTVETKTVEKDSNEEKGERLTRRNVIPTEVFEDGNTLHRKLILKAK